MERRLWDMKYVRGGCVGQPPHQSEADDSSGTYCSAYVAATLGLAAAAAAYRQPNASPFHRLFSSSFFLWTAVGQCVSGVLHQLGLGRESAAIWWELSDASTLAGLGSLLLLIFRVVAYAARIRERLLGSMNLVLLVVIAGSVLVSAALQDGGAVVRGVSFGCWLVLAGGWGYLASVAAPAQQAGMKALAALVAASGILFQALLEAECGPGGYSSCWRHCPLPTMPRMSHRAFSNILLCAGLLILGVAMYATPDLTERSADVFACVPTTADAWKAPEPWDPPQVVNDEDVEPCHQGCRLVRCSVM